MVFATRPRETPIVIRQRKVDARWAGSRSGTNAPLVSLPVRTHDENGSKVFRCLHKDGSSRYVEYTAARYHSLEGDERSIVISRDVSRSKNIPAPARIQACGLRCMAIESVIPKNNT